MSIASLRKKAATPFIKLKEFLKTCEPAAKLSMIFMGAGQIRNKQLGKGLLLILAEVVLIVYFALMGVGDLIGLFTPRHDAGRSCHGDRRG